MKEEKTGNNKAKKKQKMELRIVNDYFDVAEAAIYMKVAKGTVYQMIHKKKITDLPVRYMGRKPIFLINELRQWMEKSTATFV